MTKQIVAAVDFGPESKRVLELAFDRAGAGGAVHALHVVSGFRGVSPHPGKSEAQVSEALARLESYVVDQRSASAKDRQLFVHVLRGSVAEQIIELSYEAKASLVVMGNPGTQGGSAVKKVVHWARCPIVVVNDVDYTVEGMMPHFTVCEDCMDARAAGMRWYCDAHRDAATRAAKVIE
ncbi:MAG: universal stress protein [Deltaproteobacteria bacterium]|nr:universal stress protein [Deltaproteobacteria bacterium]